MMDYDSHTQNYAKTSLDAPFSAGNSSPRNNLLLIYMKCTASQTSRPIYSVQFKDTERAGEKKKE